MKNFSLLVLLLSILSFSNISASKDEAMADLHSATCSGGKNCYACSSCRYCKHCNAGGTCSVCASSPNALPKSTLISKPTTKTNSFTSSQCKGVYYDECGHSISGQTVHPFGCHVW